MKKITFFNILLYVILSGSLTSVFSEENDGHNNHQFSLYSYWTYSSSTITLKNRSDSSKKIDYFYCGRDGLGENGIKIDFYNFQIYYAVSLVQGGKNISKLLDSGTDDFYKISQEAGFSYFQNRFCINATYRESSSYTFFENNGLFSDPFLEDKRCKYIFFEDPDFTRKAVTGGLFLSISDSLSLKNTQQYTYRNNNSSGSLITGFNVSYCRLDSKTPLIPEEERISYNVNDSFKYIHTVTSELKLGYIYHYRSGSFYFVPELIISGGTQHQKYRDRNSNRKNWNPSAAIHTGFSTGFCHGTSDFLSPGFCFYYDYTLNTMDDFFCIIEDYRFEIMLGKQF